MSFISLIIPFMSLTKGAVWNETLKLNVIKAIPVGDIPALGVLKSTIGNYNSTPRKIINLLLRNTRVCKQVGKVGKKSSKC